MNFLTNFNLAGMEFHYALGLVGLFLGLILLGYRHLLRPGGTHAPAAPSQSAPAGK